MILISFFSQYLIDAINQSITLQKIKILPHYAYHVRDDHTQFSIYTYTYNPHQYGDGKIVCNTTLYMRLNCEFSSHNKRNDDDRRNCVEHKRDNFSPGTIFLSNMLYTDWDDVVTGKPTPCRRYTIYIVAVARVQWTLCVQMRCQPSCAIK